MASSQIKPQFGEDSMRFLNDDSDESSSSDSWAGNAIDSYPSLKKLLQGVKLDTDTPETPKDALIAENKKLDNKIEKFNQKKKNFQSGFKRLCDEATLLEAEKLKLKAERESLAQRKSESEWQSKEKITELGKEIENLKAEIETVKIERENRSSVMKDYVEKLRDIRPLFLAAGSTVTSCAELCSKIERSILDTLH